MSHDERNRAINIYRECGKLSFHASSPDRDPELMVLSANDWRMDGGELQIIVPGPEVTLNAAQAALAAKCSYFGLSVFRDAGKAAGAAAARPRKKGARKA